VSIPADTLGKWKTTAQIVMVLVLLFPRLSDQPGRSGSGRAHHVAVI
jgi:hypothetical protein